MQKLKSALTELSLAPSLLRSTSLIVLLEADGRLVDWNPAFGAKKDLYTHADTLLELALPEYRAELALMLEPSSSQLLRQGCLGFFKQKKREPCLYHCLVMPLPSGQLLFIAQAAEGISAIAAENQGLRKELAKTRSELEEAERLLKRKEVDLKGVIAQANEVSHTDALTFLHNRRQILNLLQNEVHRADRYRMPLSISMIDIDHFKNINDTYGHTEGDKVLVHLAKLLRQSVREADAVGRYGGEEFLVLLPNTRLKEASEQAARLCKAVREDEIPVGELTYLTVSIGLAEYRNGKESWQQVLTRADKAMYEAKRAGRDQWATDPPGKGDP